MIQLHFLVSQISTCTYFMSENISCYCRYWQETVTFDLSFGVIDPHRVTDPPSVQRDSKTCEFQHWNAVTWSISKCAWCRSRPLVVKRLQVPVMFMKRLKWCRHMAAKTSDSSWKICNDNVWRSGPVLVQSWSGPVLVLKQDQLDPACVPTGHMINTK